MKKNYTYIMLLSLVTMVSSCYKDLGNYDYSEINEIGVDTDATGTYFAVDRYDTLRISPTLTFTQGAIDDSQLSYKWEMYADDWANTDEKAQLLSTEKNLCVQIRRAESVTPYALVLTVTDNATGCSFTQKYQVSVQPSVLSGLMVLQDEDGRCRLDYLASTLAEPTFAVPHHIKDVYASANNGESLQGTPRSVGFTLQNKSSYEPQDKRLYVCTDKEFVMLDAATFSKKHSNYEMFMSAPQTISPEAVMRSTIYDNSTILVNDGRVHILNQSNAMIFGYQFSRALKGNQSLGNKDIKVAKYIYQADDFPSYTGFEAILYDVEGKRFVKVNSGSAIEPELKAFEPQNEAALKHFDVNNIGKDILWMAKGNAGQCFAVFTDGEKNQIYRCRFNVKSTTEDEEGNTIPNPQVNNLAMGVYELPESAEGRNAKYFDAGRYANYILYASDRNIYTYDFSARKATQINDPFTEDEVITGIKIYNVEYYTSNITDLSGTILYVSTWNGKEGKIYEFALNRTTGRLNNRTDQAEGNLKKPYNVFGGFSKVVDMCVKCQGRSD